MRKSHEAREKLLRLGIFRQVDVLIDTCHGVYSLINPHLFSPIFIPVICISLWLDIFCVCYFVLYTFIYILDEHVGVLWIQIYLRQLSL